VPAHPALDHFWVAHRRREADAAQGRGELLQPRQIERQEVAALGDDERMELVEDHRPQPPEETPRILRGQ